MADFVPLNDFIDAVRSAVDRRRSGAFFLTSPEQHSAMLTLDGGRITGVKYRNTRGYEAAEHIAGFSQVRFQTSADLTELPGQPSLDTSAVLAILADGGKGGKEGRTVTTAAPQGVSQEQLDALRSRYIRAIGPIGGAIFDEELGVEDTDALDNKALSELIDRLAEQIDDAAERGRFREDAQTQLNAARS